MDEDNVFVIDVHTEDEEDEDRRLLYLSSQDPELVAMNLRKLADRIHPQSAR